MVSSREGGLAYESKVFQKTGREMAIPLMLSCFPGFWIQWPYLTGLHYDVITHYSTNIYCDISGN